MFILITFIFMIILIGLAALFIINSLDAQLKELSNTYKRIQTTLQGEIKYMISKGVM